MLRGCRGREIEAASSARTHTGGASVSRSLVDISSLGRTATRSLPWTRKGSKAARWPACLAEALG